MPSKLTRLHPHTGPRVSTSEKRELARHREKAVANTETAARMLGGALTGSESSAVLVASTAAAGTGVGIVGGFAAAALGAGAASVVEFVRLRACMGGDVASSERLK